MSILTIKVAPDKPRSLSRASQHLIPDLLWYGDKSGTTFCGVRACRVGGNKAVPECARTAVRADYVWRESARAFGAERQASRQWMVRLRCSFWSTRRGHVDRMARWTQRPSAARAVATALRVLWSVFGEERGRLGRARAARDERWPKAADGAKRGGERRSLARSTIRRPAQPAALFSTPSSTTNTTTTSPTTTTRPHSHGSSHNR